MRQTADVSDAEPSRVRVRHVLTGEHERLRQVRLAALAADPEAFASTYARETGMPAQWWEQWAEESGSGTTQRTFVAEAEDGRWVGLALVRLDDEQPGAADLFAMWVAPEARGRHLAGMLCDAGADWAARRGCTRLTLMVVVGNTSAVRAYEGAGFVASGEATWTLDGRTLHEIVMTRHLVVAPHVREQRGSG